MTALLRLKIYKKASGILKYLWSKCNSTSPDVWLGEEYEGSLKTNSVLAEKIVIIIPTRDELPHLRKSVNSVIRGSSGLNTQIVIVDNGSVQSDTLKYLHDQASLGVQVISEDTKFNFARLVNRAILSSCGDIIVIMNNDVECESKDWLRNLILPLQVIPNSGVVGLPLKYPQSEVIQHYGVVLGRRGIASHVWRGQSLNSDFVKHTSSKIIPVSAVTFALAGFRFELVEKIGLLDENFRVGLNDVDYCMRAKSLGLTNYISTYSIASHEESLSRGKRMNVKKALVATLEVTRFIGKHGFQKDEYFH